VQIVFKMSYKNELEIFSIISLILKYTIKINISIKIIYKNMLIYHVEIKHMA